MIRTTLNRAMGLLIAAFLVAPSIVHADVLQDARDLAAAMAAAGQPEKAAEFEALVAGMSESDLQLLAEANLPALTAQFQAQAAAIANVPTEAGTRAVPRGVLPGATYPSTAPCTSSTRTDESTINPLFLSIEIARATVDTAKAALDAAEFACLTSVVAIGVGGTPGSAVCIALEIILAVAEGVVNGLEVTLATYEFCDGSIDSAEIEGTYIRTEHLHSDLETHDADIKAILAGIIGQITALQDDVKLLLKTQAENAMDRRAKTRPSVFYEERLDEVCNLAQEAINDLPVVYLLNGAAQGVHDKAIQFKITDPKRAFDECVRAYDMVTVRSDTIQ